MSVVMISQPVESVMCIQLMMPTLIYQIKKIFLTWNVVVFEGSLLRNSIYSNIHVLNKVFIPMSYPQILQAQSSTWEKS